MSQRGTQERIMDQENRPPPALWHAARRVGPTLGPGGPPEVCATSSGHDDINFKLMAMIWVMMADGDVCTNANVARCVLQAYIQLGG